ncbi:MAG TPA: hypothetical protein VM555_08790 [Tahibacter sp.]|nr:hypothetical protein [Tahibacter sp.]
MQPVKPTVSVAAWIALAIAMLLAIGPVAAASLWFVEGRYLIAGTPLTFLRLAWPGGAIGMAFALASWLLAGRRVALRRCALVPFALTGVSVAYLIRAGLI